MGEKFVGEKYTGEKSVGQKYAGETGMGEKSEVQSLWVKSP